ncbi:MAG: 2Fe-2S iron-sulfur cluster-binding protein, partial [Planctomycetota bacterium]
MITLTIDDKKVEVEDGSTILQAAQKHGIQIPTLCAFKSLAPYGACRVCLVEIVGPRDSWISASCVYAAQEGMVVKSDTERVLKTRRMMLELLLARC